jgi:hypothetical protein
MSQRWTTCQLGREAKKRATLPAMNTISALTLTLIVI